MPFDQRRTEGGLLINKSTQILQQQRSDKWLEWRSSGVGASDLPVIMGSDPYKSEYTLWNEKCHFQKGTKPNYFMQHGVKCEPIARRWIEEHYNWKLDPICVEHKEKPFFRASLDGYDREEGVLVEIKCPKSQKILNSAFCLGKLPNYWVDQVQWQMFLVQPRVAYVGVWDDNKRLGKLIEVLPSEKRQKEMVEKATAFWKRVKFGRKPKQGKNDYKVVEDDRLEPLLREFEKLNNKKGAIEKRREVVKQKIVEFGSGEAFKCNGFVVKKMQARRSYDFEAMKLDGVDLKKYEKPTKSFFTIFCP